MEQRPWQPGVLSDPQEFSRQKGHPQRTGRQSPAEIEDVRNSVEDTGRPGLENNLSEKLVSISLTEEAGILIWSLMGKKIQGLGTVD